MENFVLVGKAKTVFRLLELKLKQEELLKRRDEIVPVKRETGKPVE